VKSRRSHEVKVVRAKKSGSHKRKREGRGVRKKERKEENISQEDGDTRDPLPITIRTNIVCRWAPRKHD
jgi:hypothetical protein